MRIKMKKRTVAMISAVMIAALSISGCGSGTNAPQPTEAPYENPLGDAYPENYENYIDSFTGEFGQFVDGDMEYILRGVGSLNESNYDEWKLKYTDALDRTTHWYSEVDAASMFCPSEKIGAHEKLISTVGTIYKIMDGLKPRVEVADNGDLSQLTSMGDNYIKAIDIANDMWDQTLAEVK